MTALLLDNLAAQLAITGGRLSRLRAEAPLYLEKTMSQPESTTILLSLIDPSPLNPRKTFDETELKQLAESVKSQGILVPLIVRPRPHTINRGPTKGKHDRYELVDGERRWRAAADAGLAEVPAIVRELTDLEVLEIALVSTEQRVDVSPLEKARTYQQLMDDHGYTVEMIRDKVGKAAATIYGLISLLKLPAKACKAVEAGDLPMSSAQLIARVPGAKAQAELTSYALKPNQWSSGPASYRELKEKVQRSFMVELKRAPFSQKDAALVPEAGSCEACPKRTGNDKINYPDSRADVCTDPGCYRGKLEAHKKRLLELAKAEGTKVLTGKEAQAALGYSAPYFDLKDQCYEDKKRRSYKQLVGEQLKAKTVIVVDDEGEVHRLVPKKEASEVLKKEHKITRGGSGSSGPDPWRAKQAKKHKEERLKNQAGALALAKIVEDVEGTNVAGLLPHGWTDLLVQCAWRQLGYDSRKQFLGRRGQEPGKDGPAMERAFKNVATGQTWRQALGLLAELLLTPAMVAGGIYRSQDKERAEICETFAIDFKALLSGLQESKKIKGKKIKPARAGSVSDRSEPGRKRPTGQADQGAVATPQGQTPVANAPGSKAERNGHPPAEMDDQTLEAIRLRGFIWGNQTKPLEALKNRRVTTIKHALELMFEEGKPLSEALATVPGVGKGNAALIAEGIARYRAARLDPVGAAQR